MVFEPCTYGENLYFVIFVDEFTRMLWVYPIKRKSELFFINLRHMQKSKVEQP